MKEAYSNTSIHLDRKKALRRIVNSQATLLTMEDAFKPGATPIKAAMMTLCDQGACSMDITFVSTAISNDTAIRISQGCNAALKNQNQFHSHPRK